MNKTATPSFWGSVHGWLHQRFPIDQQVLISMGREPVPGHLKRWWWCLGGTPAFLFLVQAVTGVLLTFYYVPTPEKAYESVQMITNEIRFGWYIRSLHKWSATLMIIALLLHMMRVFFTGAYRKPREGNWILGCFLLLLTLGFGFTGYSLIYEQLSYWGATVAGNILDAVPLAGPYLADFLRGGPHVGSNMLTRLFVFHIGALPTIMVAVLLAHLLLMRAHGVSELEPTSEADAVRFPFIPDHLLTEIGIAMFLMFLLSFLAVVFPVGMGPKANPLVTPEHIKPEWYFFWAFRWLKLVPDRVAVITQGLFLGILVAWPLFDGWIRRKRPGSEASVWVGACVVGILLTLTIWEAVALLH
jgi:quinol-cytochrome oxidoreductase complex cytochrome b subunit